MNFKKITIALAILLTIFAVSAKAQNPFPDLCPAGYQSQTFQVPTCAGLLDVEICWHCPSAPGDTAFKMVVKSISGLTTTNCNWKADVVAFMTDWNFIKSRLCPGWDFIQPCPNNAFGVTLQWPLCQRYHLIGSAINVENCLPIKCLCVGYWKYCYENGIIHQTWISTSVSEAPGYSPSDCSPIPCPVSITNVPQPTPLNPISICFEICL